MTTPFIGEITMFGGTFAPRNWALCDGALLAVSQNQALFSLLGTTYGGDGRTTFGLPDLRGRLPIHEGSGPGLTPRQLGERGGGETDTILAANMPNHSHTVLGTTGAGDSNNPAGKVPAVAPVDAFSDQAPDPANAKFGGTAIADAPGGNQPHNNLMPYLALNFIIALQGVYPSRN